MNKSPRAHWNIDWSRGHACGPVAEIRACGTSVGIGAMKEPVNTVTVAIDGIGELTNEFRQ
jgi:hypothetical protein